MLCTVASVNPRPAVDGSNHPTRRVGPYELLLPIARGGMAAVFLARKRGPGGFERNVALKLTHVHLRDEPGWAQELIEEAKLAARIRHPNVVQVLDVEDDPAGVFLVMDYIEGDTLSALVKHATQAGERIPRDIALRILADALAGLHAAHELRDEDGQNAGVVHRDFTPQNILIGVDGVARLTDFGIAKAETRVSHTMTGTVKGKTGYVAPEHVRGQPLDRRADVWAAGVVAWELLAGRRLHPAGENDFIELLVRAATQPPQRLQEVVSDVPFALDETIAGALALDRARRWPTAEAFRERLLAAYPGGLADPAIVGEYVQMVAGAALQKRRAQIAAIDAEPLVVEPEAPPSVPVPALPLAISVPPKRSRTLASVLSLLVMVAIGAAVWIGVVRVRPRALATGEPPKVGAVPSPPIEEGPIGSAPVAPSTSMSAPVSLHIKANAPVARLFLGDDERRLGLPSRSAIVPAPTAAVRARAIAVDGREAIASVAAGATEVTFTFSATRPRTRSPAASPPAVSLGDPLAPSPYE